MFYGFVIVKTSRENFISSVLRPKFSVSLCLCILNIRVWWCVIARVESKDL